MPLMIPDDEQDADPHAPPFRVSVLIPEFVKRLINRLVRFLSRRRVN